MEDDVASSSGDHGTPPPQDEDLVVDAAQPVMGRARGASGIVIVSAATGLAGLAAYVITWLVPRAVGFAEYTTFAGFWALVFLVVAMLSGIQQEVTRASHPSEQSESSPRSNVVGIFSAVCSALVALIVLATAPAWAHLTFPGTGAGLVVPLAVGLASYVAVAALSGILYGAADWWGLFAIVSIEGVLRFLLIGGVLLVTNDIVALAWAVVLPFPIAAATVYLIVRSRLRGRTRLDVGLGSLTWNVSRTVVAAGSMGLLISGFPLVVQLTSRAENPATVGLAILASTLVRAPLIVSGMALQSYLIVLFRSRSSRAISLFIRIEGAVLALGGLLALAGFFAGPPLFGVLFPGQQTPDATFIAVLVLSSTIVAALCVSAPAVLARSQHVVYTVGWVTAAAATVLLLVMPIEFSARIVLALTVAPAIGLAVHLAFLIGGRR